MTDLHTLAALPRGLRPLSNEQGRYLASRYPDLPKSPDQCITCRGQRTFQWYDENRTNVVQYHCPCPAQYVMHRRFLWSGIGEAYQRLGWADFTYLPDEAGQAALDYIDHADGYIASGMGLILTGSRGNGKTMLASLLAKRLVSQGHDCYMTFFNDMISLFTDGWRAKDERLWFNARVRNAGVLFIDDLGRERNKGAGSVGESMLEEVIRHRVSRAKPTILTTNLKEDEIAPGYGGHNISLLSERSITVPFIGQDRRREMQKRFTDEVKAGLRRPVVVA